MRAQQQAQETIYVFTVSLSRTELDEFLSGTGGHCEKLREELRQARTLFKPQPVMRGTSSRRPATDEVDVPEVR